MKKEKRPKQFANSGELLSPKHLRIPIYGDFSVVRIKKGNATSAGASDKRRADVNLRRF